MRRYLTLMLQNFHFSPMLPLCVLIPSPTGGSGGMFSLFCRHREVTFIRHLWMLPSARASRSLQSSLQTHRAVALEARPPQLHKRVRTLLEEILHN